MKRIKEPRFSNARKQDLGDFVMRELIKRDLTLTAPQVRKICSHLYTRLRTKRGLEDFNRQRIVAQPSILPANEGSANESKGI